MSIVYWHWLALGAVLALIEVLVPGVVFLWLGIAAIVTGLILLLVPGLAWELQLLAFAVLAVVAIYAGRRFLGRGAVVRSDQPFLNQRGARYVGQVFRLDEALHEGRGRLRVGDGWWPVVLASPGEPDPPAGTLVRVVAADGATLKVERA